MLITATETNNFLLLGNGKQEGLIKNEIPIMGLIQDPNLGREPHADSTSFIIIPIMQLFLCKLLHFM